MLTRDRHPTPIRGLMPSPAPLPSLRDALARRATVFGPVDLDEVTLTPRRRRQALGDALRRLAARVDPCGAR